MRDQASVRLLAHLFNGNLVIDRRISQLKYWLDIFKDIELKPTPKVPSLNNAWLSGFTDAEGCFNIKIEKRSNTVTGY